MLNASVLLQAVISGLLLGTVYTLIAVGYSLVFGSMRLANFAHGQLTMMAMYASYLMHHNYGIDPFASLIVISPLFFAIGFAVYRGFIRFIVSYNHWTQIIVTLGFGLLLQNFALLLFGGDLRGVTTTYTSSSVRLGQLMVSMPKLAAAAVALLSTAGLYILLARTSIGKAIRAVAANREGALLCGIPTERVFAFAFAIATMLEGIAGATVIPFWMVNPFTGTDLGNKAFIIVVIAGLGSVNGAVFAGLLIGVIESVASLFVTGSFTHAISFVVLVVVLLVKPTGLFGASQEEGRSWARRRAQAKS